MAVTGRTLHRRYVLLLLVLTAVTLVALDSQSDDSGPLGALGSIAHEIVAPVQRATGAVVEPIADWLDGVVSAGSLEAENDDLRAALAEAEAEAARDEDARARVAELSELLELPWVEGIDSVTADVISPPVGNFEHTLVIGKGSSSGIRVDAPVIASGGLLGRVIEVSPSQAKVLLLTDERFNVSVRSARDRLVGIAVGNGSGTLDLEFLAGVDDGDPGEDPPVLIVGDAIVTSGLDASLYPPGIPVGEISEVIDDPTTSARTGTLAPFVDIDVVETVQVLDWDPVRDDVAPLAEPGSDG